MAIKKLFREGTGKGNSENSLNRLLRPLFIAWVKNKLVPIHFMLQRPELKRPKERIQDAIRTVHELCGHYCYDDDYEPYFFHLISILEKFPNVTKEECERGVEDLRGILRLFNIKWEEGGIRREGKKADH